MQILGFCTTDHRHCVAGFRFCVEEMVGGYRAFLVLGGFECVGVKSGARLNDVVGGPML